MSPTELRGLNVTITCHATKCRKTNGHATSCHSTDFHATNCHATNCHAANSHGTIVILFFSLTQQMAMQIIFITKMIKRQILVHMTTGQKTNSHVTTCHIY